VTGCCEYGDEPSGSCATDVRVFSSNSLNFNCKILAPKVTNIQINLYQFKL
jgi:hypothetical protein